jgi:hypothetical protein
MAEAGIPCRWIRLNTMYLLVKIASFVKEKCTFPLSKGADLN